MGYLVFTLCMAVMGFWSIDLGKGEDVLNIKRHNIGIAKPEEYRGQGSCQWENPPPNGYNFHPCSEGWCQDTAGIHKSNATLRFTRCDSHYVLVEGSDKDFCVNGQWSSSGHKCIPCGRSQNTDIPFADLLLMHQGQNSSLGDFPWMAALYTQDAGSWDQICGGTLISPRLVLTAAHCLHVGGRQLKPEELQVGLGKLYRSFYQEEKTSVNTSVKEIVIPKRYRGGMHMFAMDIALLVLQQSVDTGSYIMPACVDWGNTMGPKHNDVGYLAGWGITELSSPSAVLKWTSQKYVQYEQCQDILSPGDKKFLTQDKFCVKAVKGGKADKGDSGGGLTFMYDGVHYVYGVVSTKITEDGKNVRLFTNLLNDVHLAWLRKHWRRLLFNNQECLQSSDCSGSRECVQGSCVDFRPVTIPDHCTNSGSSAPIDVRMDMIRSHGTLDTFYGTQFPFSINGRQYFYRHEQNQRRWFIQELLPGGLMGEVTDTGYWDTYFKASFPYSINGRHFFLAEADVGRHQNSFFIRELLPGGKMGTQTAWANMRRFYANMFSYEMQGRRFFYGLNGQPGDLFYFIAELTPEGKVGKQESYGYSLSYYPMQTPFSINGKQYFFAQGLDKQWFIAELLPRVGTMKDFGYWTDSYNTLAFSIGCRQFMYAHINNNNNYNNNFWFIKELLPEGKFAALDTDRGYWEHFNDVTFVYSMEGRYFLYTHTKATNGWSIREIKYSLHGIV